MSTSRKATIHSVILAGGAGERFWPASRSHHPKPFLEVVGGKSLLSATLTRAKRISGPDHIWIVCGADHEKAIRRGSGLGASRILVEPQRRNTAMAVAWAATRIAAEDPDAVMCVLPADHHIPDEKAFAKSVRLAARAAKDAGVLVTLGVTPTRPDTGYGYIQLGDAAPGKLASLHAVRRFVEKPDAARARRYLTHGGYLWNSGVFVWGARTLLDEIESCAPPLHRALAPLRRAPKGRNQEAVESSYDRAPSVAIDVAVLEQSRHVWTLPVTFGWSDVGTWSSLAEELGVGEPVKPAGCGTLKEAGDGNRVIAGDVLTEDANRNLIWGGKRLVALLGVDDLAVVDTDDVILVTRLSRSPDVRRLVASLKASGRSELI